MTDFLFPWRKRIPLTINNGQVPSPQTDFPLSINKVFPNLIGQTKNQLRFTSSNNVLLDYEIQEFDSLTGKLVAWGKKPLASDGDLIYVYFDNPLAVDAQNPPAVWSNGFEAVYHMNQVGAPLDSLGNYNTTQVGVDTPLVQGKIGQAKDFRQRVPPSFYQIPNIVFPNNDAITISAWASTFILSTKDGIVSQIFDNGNLRFALFFVSPAIMSSQIINNNNDVFTSGSSSFVLNELVHWTGTYDRNLIKTYNNSVEIDFVPLTVELPENNQDWMIGNYEDPSASIFTQWRGIIDEVRISNVARDQAWITTEFNSMNNFDTFFSTGVVQSLSHQTKTITGDLCSVNAVKNNLCNVNSMKKDLCSTDIIEKALCV